jgi:hypothetical protein
MSLTALQNLQLNLCSRVQGSLHPQHLSGFLGLSGIGLVGGKGLIDLGGFVSCGMVGLVCCGVREGVYCLV